MQWLDDRKMRDTGVNLSDAVDDRGVPIWGGRAPMLPVLPHRPIDFKKDPAPRLPLGPSDQSISIERLPEDKKVRDHLMRPPFRIPPWQPPQPRTNIPSVEGATAGNQIAEIYNRGPGLASLINPRRTPVGGNLDRQKMMDMQRETFRAMLNQPQTPVVPPTIPGDPSGPGGGGPGGGGPVVPPINIPDIPFIDYPIGPDGLPEAPVMIGEGQQIPSLPLPDQFSDYDRDFMDTVSIDDLADLGEPTRWDNVKGGIKDAAEWVADKGVDLAKLHPLVGGIGSIPGILDLTGADEVDAYGDTFKGANVSAEGLGLYPEDPAFVEAPQDAAITEAMVENALAKDPQETIDFVDNLDVMPERIKDLQAQEVFENVQKGLQAKEDTSAAFGDHMGAMFEPDSAWGNATPMLSSDRDAQFMSGGVGLSGRMLPKASSGFGGRNPFAGEAPLPGSPDYPDYVIDSMGFDPVRIEDEVSRIVEADLPFTEATTPEGDTVLIDKQTGQMTVIPVHGNNRKVNRPRGRGRAGGGMNLGGLVGLMPLKY